MNNLNKALKNINANLYSEWLIFLIIFFVKNIALSDNSIRVFDSSNLDKAPPNGQYYISNRIKSHGHGYNKVIALGAVADQYAIEDLEEQKKKNQAEIEKNKLCNKFSYIKSKNIYLKTDHDENANIIQLTQLTSTEIPIYVFIWSELSGNSNPENSNTELTHFIQNNNLNLFKVIDRDTQDPLDVIFLAKDGATLQNYLLNYHKSLNNPWMTWINDTCIEGESYVSLASAGNNLTGYLALKSDQNYQSGATIWTGKDDIKPLGIMVCKQKLLSGFSLEDTLTKVLSFEKISSGTIFQMTSLTSAISEASTLQLNLECDY